MGRLNTLLRNSLAFKVSVSTLLLSLAVGWLTGSVLNSKLSTGIKEVNLNSALLEARSTIYSVQYQILIAQGRSGTDMTTVVEKIISGVTNLTAYKSSREIVLLRDPANIIRKYNYEMTSNLVDPRSVPQDLRERVQKGNDLNWANVTLKYAGATTVPALVVGQKIALPNAGVYEMYLLFSLVDQNATLALIKSSLLLAGFALLLLVLLVTWLVLRQVVRPVRDAASIASKFTRGDFGQRMEVTSKDEIATLGNAFNEMADSFEKQITRLENLSRVQQRFVSDVSHELRTPLTTLRMASGIIHTSRFDFDPSVARSAELLVAQLDRFEQLLEDLLEVSRFDAEAAVLESLDFDIVKLIERSVEDLATVALEKVTSIAIFSAEPSILMQADVRRVERILRNLLNNALDHAEEKPIEITIVSNENDVAVGVRDYGIGLDSNSLTRVFDRFWRADPSRARTRGGTGLGLSIALEDARLHNGELEAWGSPNKGTHFVLTLPRRAGGSIQARLINLEPKDFKG